MKILILNFWPLVYKLVHRQGTFNSFIFNVNLCSTLDIVSSIIDLQLCVSDCFLNFNFRARRLRSVERHVNLIVNPWIVSDACSLSSHVLLTRYICMFILWRNYNLLSTIGSLFRYYLYKMFCNQWEIFWKAKNNEKFT